MSLLKFHFPPYESPPNKYRWYSPLGGAPIASDNKYEWLDKIAKYCRDNNIELAPDWKEKAEDALCRALPPGWCTYSDGTDPSIHIDARLTADDWRRGMSTLFEILTTPYPLVDQETAEARARICAACPANVGIQGCSSCAGVADKVVQIRGARKTESDSVLRNCAVCRCALRAMVFIKPEILEKGVTDEHREQYKFLPWCWKAKETQALKELETPA